MVIRIKRNDLVYYFERLTLNQCENNGEYSTSLQCMPILIDGSLFT